MTRTEIINSLIKKFNYQSYLEVGTQNCVNYNKVHCLDKTGVDPEPLRVFPGIVKIVSDDFFKNNKKGFDIVFIDGLHHSNQVYRDIVNSIRFLNKGGTIVCHDMNPISKEMQEIPRKVKVWNGDCWKAFVWLSVSKGLKMFTINTDYGVGIIRLEKNVEISTENLTLLYSDLEKNRKKWLNLISVDEFKIWLENVV